MFLKAPLHYSLLLFLGFLAATTTCTRATLDVTGQPETRSSFPDVKNSVSVQGQVLPPEGIHSIQLYRDIPENAPIIKLNGNEQLTLKFDELGFDIRTFRVRFTHHDADWSSSTLLPNFYQQGFREDVITDSQVSQVQRPAYTHYTYKFPNNDLDFLISGNYMIEVYDVERDEIVFSLPFFVQENTGLLETQIEELFGMDERYLLHHQIFATYSYPDEVVIPDVDLQTRFVQNHFWGRARQADVVGMATTGEIRSHNIRDNAYVGRFEFRRLDLQRLQQEAYNIIEVRPETIPPKVFLAHDVVNLDINPGISQSHRFGTAIDNLEARYADVYFELELPHQERTNSPVYVIGPFNNWSINENQRMIYNRETESYTGNAIIKEGMYDYKYALVEDSTVNDIRLDASLADSRQIYHTFIYFNDPQTLSDRLLKVHAHTTR